jgi:hypothetical protein
LFRQRAKIGIERPMSSGRTRALSHRFICFHLPVCNP